MTGFLNVPAFVSATTVASFQDLGYTTIALVASVPLPAPVLMLFAGLACLGGLRLKSNRGKLGTIH